jgi:hypothetical protein
VVLPELLSAAEVRQALAKAGGTELRAALR